MRKLSEWFTDESKWTKGVYYHRSGHGTERTCLLGAIYLLDIPNASRMKLINKVAERLGLWDAENNLGILRWNDSPLTTYNDLMRLIEYVELNEA
jgi:hypothetical protein